MLILLSVIFLYETDTNAMFNQYCVYWSSGALTLGAGALFTSMDQL